MAEGESPKEIIRSGLEDALSTMEGMLGNTGQETIYADYVVQAFMENAQSDVESGWEDVELDDYMDFMGEIIAEGNAIMQDAYDYAQEMQATEDLISEAGGDLLDFLEALF